MAVAFRTVKKWCKRFMEGRRRANELAEAIASILKQRAFIWPKVLSRYLRLATTSCLWILYRSLGTTKMHLA
jgi:hypothetical protein